MKLLILCDIYPPAFAPRMGYLCKYLSKKGWQPVVVTERIDEDMFAFLTGYAEVIYIDYYKAKGRFRKKLEWLGVFFLDFFFDYKDRAMARTAAGILEAGGFGGILGAAYRTFPLPAAARLAKRFRLPFVADTRDILEQFATHEYITQPFRTVPWLDNLVIRAFRWKLLKRRNQALREADCITTVSPWHVEVMKQYNSQVELIYNGYDPELFYPEQIRTSRFILSYTGRLVSLETRDPKPLFEAIALLAEEGKITPDTFRVKWYMDGYSWSIIQPLSREYGIEPFMDYEGYVSADAVPAIMNRSSILLQLANNAANKGPKGIMSTKLFESLAVEKPLLCVRSDEGCLEETIRRTRAGASARNAREAYEFIERYYKEWKEKGYTGVQSDRGVVESFSREKQAEQFMRIFAQLAARKK